VVKNTDAVNEIKTLGCERKVEYISLKNRGFASGQILCCHFRRQAKINAHDVRSPASGNIRETPHPASHVEHELSSKTLGAKTGALLKVAFRPVAFAVVQLRARVHVPLETKTPSVLLLVDKARHSVDLRINSAAGRAG
jgi:hypothetical protein